MARSRYADFYRADSWNKYFPSCPPTGISLVKIQQAQHADVVGVKQLFVEYQQSLDTDLCFQGFDEELNGLPGRYAPPGGRLLIAVENQQLIGCVGLRARTCNEAELKRLYVLPAYQGRGVGKQLFLSAMEEARLAGYHSIVLDTLPAMTKAQTLYRQNGFTEIPAYYDNPEDGVRYFRFVF